MQPGVPNEIPTTSAVTLVIVEPGAPPRRIPLDKNAVTIGRAADNDVVLSGIDVSRYHARIELLGPIAFIVDLGGPFGTFVNESRIDGMAHIGPGEIIRIGSTRLAVEGVIDRSSAKMSLRTSVRHMAVLERVPAGDDAPMPRPIEATYGAPAGAPASSSPPRSLSPFTPHASRSERRAPKLPAAVPGAREQIAAYRPRRARLGRRIPLLVYVYEPAVREVIDREARDQLESGGDAAHGTPALALNRALREGELLHLELAAAGCDCETTGPLAWSRPFVRFDAAILPSRELAAGPIQVIGTLRASGARRADAVLARLAFDLELASGLPPVRWFLTGSLATAATASFVSGAVGVLPTSLGVLAGAALLAGTAGASVIPAKALPVPFRARPPLALPARAEPSSNAEFVAHYAVRAIELRTVEPRLALHTARQCAEAIARDLYERHFGDPGARPLDSLLKPLHAASFLPEQVAVPFGTVQRWGNMGSHPTDVRAIDPDNVGACILALRAVVHWYFVDALGAEVPRDVVFPELRA